MDITDEAWKKMSAVEKRIYSVLVGIVFLLVALGLSIRIFHGNGHERRPVPPPATSAPASSSAHSPTSVVPRESTTTSASPKDSKPQNGELQRRP